MNSQISESKMNLEGTPLLVTAICLNIGALISDISPILKGCLFVVTALSSIMALLNQYKQFQKNYKTLWVVVTINHVFTILAPKRNRILKHRKKQSNDSTHIS